MAFQLLVRSPSVPAGFPQALNSSVATPATANAPTLRRLPRTCTLPSRLPLEASAPALEGEGRVVDEAGRAHPGRHEHAGRAVLRCRPEVGSGDDDVVERRSGGHPEDLR